jgi:hypothetical protein
VKTGSIKRNKVSESSLSAKPRSALASVAQARAAMLSGLALCDAESVALASALGRVLAGAVTATRDQPPFAVSQMDGYAVRAGDTPGALTLIGESSAGWGFGARAHDKVTMPPARAGQHVRPRAMSGGERLGRCDGSGL